MKSKGSILVLIGFLLFSSSVLAESWRTYFPTNTLLKAKVMVLASSKDYEHITRKLQQGITEHQEWFKVYAQNLKPGQPLPYHKNLGVTQEEYNNFLEASKHMGVKQIDSVAVEFLLEKNGTIKIKSDLKSPINDLIVGEHSVTSQLGTMTEFSEINNTNKDAPTGPWHGVQWQLTDFDERSIQKQKLSEMKGKKVKLAVGRLSNTGEGILYYDVKDIDMSQNKNNQFSYIIFYPLPTKI